MFKQRFFVCVTTGNLYSHTKFWSISLWVYFLFTFIRGYPPLPCLVNYQMCSLLKRFPLVEFDLWMQMNYKYRSMEIEFCFVKGYDKLPINKF